MFWFGTSVFTGLILGLVAINLSINSNFSCLLSSDLIRDLSCSFSLIIGLKLVIFSHSEKECSSFLSKLRGLPSCNFSSGVSFMFATVS